MFIFGRMWGLRFGGQDLELRVLGLRCCVCAMKSCEAGCRGDVKVSYPYEDSTVGP